MKMNIYLILICLIILSSNIQADNKQNSQLIRLQQLVSNSVQTTLKTKLYKNVDVALLIATPNGNNTIYSRDINRPYIPASAIKILPSTIALIKFKPEYQFKTPIKTDGKIENNTLKGNLYIIGQGDPGIMISDLEKAVKALKEQGINKIDGSIIYDVSFLDEEQNRFAPNARNLYTPPCALTVNYGWIDVIIKDGDPAHLKLNPETSYAKLTYNVKTSTSTAPGRPTLTYSLFPWGDAYNIQGTITQWDKQYHYTWLGVSRPGLYTATLFKEICKKSGITFAGLIKQGISPDNTKILTDIISIPLKDIVQEMNQQSNNIIAEMLNKDLGAAFISLPGTREKGLNVINQFCEDKIGFPKNEFVIADGSGLSVQNKISANCFIKALNYFYNDKDIQKAFIPTLAWQGHHSHAMNPVTPDDIKIYVKTGTLSVIGVNTTVGYIILDKTKEVFSFALLANRHNPGPMTYSGTLTNPLLTSLVEAFELYLKQIK